MSYPLKKLGEILEVQNGYAFNSKLFNENKGMPLIRIRSIKNSNIDTKYNGEFKNDYVVNDGDFLIGMDGEFRCYKWEGGPALLNQRVCRLVFKDLDIEGAYIFYGINKFLKDIEDVTPFVTVKHISSKQIKDIDFPLPPLQTQKVIVTKLDTAFEKLDASIELAKKNLENVEELGKSVLEEVFGGSEYQEKKLSETCDFKNGFAFKSGDFNELGIGKQVIRIGNVLNLEKNQVFIEEDNRYNMFELIEEDIILGMTGTRGKKDYLFPGIILEDNKYYLNQRVGRLRCGDTLLFKFLYFYLKTSLFRSNIFLLETGTVNQGNISGKDILNQNIPLPPLEKQKEIVEYLDRVFEENKRLKESYEQKIASLQEMKQSLLAEAFEGRLVREEEK